MSKYKKNRLWACNTFWLKQKTYSSSCHRNTTTLSETIFGLNIKQQLQEI